MTKLMSSESPFTVTKETLVVFLRYDVTTPAKWTP